MTGKRIPHNARGTLTLTDAAAYLSVSEHTLNNWIRGGEIQLATFPMPSGKHLPRVPVAELDRFIERNLDGAVAAGKRGAA